MVLLVLPIEDYELQSFQVYKVQRAVIMLTKCFDHKFYQSLFQVAFMFWLHSCASDTIAYRIL